MNGTTISGVCLLTEPDPSWKVAGVGDFNGDGKADILWRNSSTGENYVYLMNGTTNTGVYLRTQADLNWQVADPGDLNGAGKAPNHCGISSYCVKKDCVVYHHA